MHTGLEEAPNGFAKLAAFYAARARGGVGLIVTGGIAPNFAGRLEPRASQLSFAVAGRASIARSPTPCTRRAAASRCRSCTPAATRITRCRSRRRRSSSPITPFKPRALTRCGIERTHRRLRALRARSRSDAGYDGVEIMGSEGYLINQFIARADQPARRRLGRRVREPHPLRRRDRAPHARGGRAATSSSSTGCRCSTWSRAAARWDEVVALAQAIEAAGATLINTGIGWHEARIPTIATMVPRARVHLGDARGCAARCAFR